MNTAHNATPAPIQYPAGALVRVSQICRNTKTKQPGLLPINRATWYKWLKEGKVPPGQQLSSKTTVWPVELVLSIGKVDEEARNG